LEALSRTDNNTLSDEEKNALISAKEAALKETEAVKAVQADIEEKLNNTKTEATKHLKELRLAQEKISELESKTGNARSIDELVSKHAQELEKAVADAKAQALIEEQASSDSLAKSQEALVALEARLKEEHEKELESLKSALEHAQRRPREDATLTQLEQAAAQVTTLRGEMETLSKAKDEAHAQGIEQGRQEMAMKIKLKDAQISKISKRLQEVEQALASATSDSTVSASQSGATSVVTTSQNTAPAPNPAAIKASGTTQVPRGIGRGRGGSIRGVAGRGRGGTLSAAVAAASSSAAPTAPASNTSILGAAVKRTRDSEPETSQDSLAKRLKPSGGPVSIIRNRPLPDPGT